MDIARHLDEVLSTGQILHQLWRDIEGTGDIPPEWVDFLALEQQAAEIREYHPVLIPGLLQADGYIRWVFKRAYDSSGVSEKAVAARLARLGSLKSEVRVRVVIDEVVLGRVSESADVMREQYDHIRQLAEAEKAIVMILPGYAPWRPIATGGFRIMTLEGGRQIVHVSHMGGHAVKENPSEAAALVSFFGDLQAESLSPTESLALLKKMRDEL
ncbi:DUF5753 domain-containing protein [Streptomonospora litoralis]|uniref:DUF5753 domain-containing protein n=1 Tax=Streptomonospora litoralis TaxID=2498135 RepID=A0A4P6PYV0_9ACTN|nr:DUF5753 domain-containing protein [Streptomonospora litoralis]QBI52061.1 hypothetical protein EKD16_01220 [Streptomonospora litoralis]